MAEASRYALQCPDADSENEDAGILGTARREVRLVLILVILGCSRRNSEEGEPYSLDVMEMKR